MSSIRTLLGESFGPEALPSFDRYTDLLLARNSELNLTGFNTHEKILEELVYDAVILTNLLPSAELPLKGQMVDIGSGSGSPGIPIATLCPDLHVILVESIKKKALFLTETVQVMGMAHVGVMGERSEVMANDSMFRGLFDYSVSKAVGSLSELIELSMPLLKLGGVLFAYKGPLPSAQKEIEEADRAFKELHAEVAGLYPYTLPVSGADRTIVAVKKKGMTPPQFPRRPGMAHKRPL